ncbi:hypothetical protein FO519_001457 [Halicephalobus sp. NKZ332]|nr:hypothetical protein FO519_001457 [Halicephalobus sp. NKZ332]
MMCQMFCDPSCCTGSEKTNFKSLPIPRGTACDKKKKFDSKKSSTYIEDGLGWSIEYGVYTYGGLDTENCGDVIEYEKLTSAAFFQFKMKKIGVESYSSSEGWDVISDTGTSFIGGPWDVTMSLAHTVGGQYDDETGSYDIDCNAKFPHVSIVIGSHTYYIQKKNLVVNVGDGKCAFAMFPFDYGGFGPAWILGDPWIRQYCNIYSFEKQIGFAPTKK